MHKMVSTHNRNANVPLESVQKAVQLKFSLEAMSRQRICQDCLHSTHSAVSMKGLTPLDPMKVLLFVQFLAWKWRSSSQHVSDVRKSYQQEQRCSDMIFMVYCRHWANKQGWRGLFMLLIVHGITLAEVLFDIVIYFWSKTKSLLCYAALCQWW